MVSEASEGIEYSGANIDLILQVNEYYELFGRRLFRSALVTDSCCRRLDCVE